MDDRDNDLPPAPEDYPTADPPRDPEPAFGAGFDPDAFEARLKALAADPEHRRRLERLAAADRARAARALASLAEARDVPGDDDLRAVALADDPPETAALGAFRAAVEWRRGRRCGCVAVVGGPRGTGKSCALAWVLLRSEASALYLQSPEVTATPRNGFSENELRWQRWLTVPLLGLDDLGTEAGDPELVAALLWQRYDRGLRTLATTNLTRAAVAERYLRGEIGARLADRLVYAQGNAVAGAVGPGGLPWYAAVAGASLRSSAARAALVGGG